MFAVIKTGGTQYRVAATDELTVERLAGEPGEIVTIGNVLMVSSEGNSRFGAPVVSGASVAAEIVEHSRGPKVIAFKKRRRKNSRRKRGHRQDLTVIRITEILTDGAKPKAALARAKPVQVAAAPAASTQPVSGARDSSNLSLISGIGPTIEKKLHAAGITTWEQIAAWTEADVAKWEGELALRGRAGREEWVAQAKELLDGKPPRAKIDRDAAEKDA